MAPGAHLSQRGLMRGVAQESTSRYLSMALASRKLMKHLDAFTLTGEMDEAIVSALRNLLMVMEGSWQTNNSFAPVPGQFPFGRYDQASVVNEFNSQTVRDKLSCIVNRKIPDTDRKAVVREIKDFLYDLENRALYKFNEQPNEREW